MEAAPKGRKTKWLSKRKEEREEEKKKEEENGERKGEGKEIPKC